VNDDLTACSATDLGRRIRARDLSPVEVTEAVLDRVDDLNPALGAFITVTADLARASAREAAQRAVERRLIGPLDGIPFSIKDLEPTAGIRTTFGSKFTEEYVPDTDSLVAGRLRRSGGVLIGKTNTPQLGYKDMCDNLVAASCVNPWNPACTPGGSSGGAAAAVAAGLGPVAQGSDGAGSIRIPSSLCGVVGLKPSFGRVPVVPSGDHWAARVHNGPIARTVEDVALLLGVMAGADVADPLSFGEAGAPWPVAPGTSLSGLRVAWSADFGYGAVDPEVRTACEAAARALEGLGAAVDACDPTWGDPAVFHRVLYSVGLAMLLRERARARPEWIEDTLQALIDTGLSYSACDLKQAEMDRSRFYDQALAFFERFDLLLSPSMPMTAWSAEPGEGPMEVAGHSLDTQRRSLFAYPFNLTGQPALSLPCGRSPAGLPIGVQLVGRWRRDDIVLSTAAALEQALDLAFPIADPRGGPGWGAVGATAGATA
jgi:Asp-tRNA(Asn)/Glu-tRNA(Gln) amidotransferase A subunit family amidase